MASEVNLEGMTDDEIGVLGTRCLDALSLAERVQVALRAFHGKEDLEELSEHLQVALDELEIEGEGEQ